MNTEMRKRQARRGLVVFGVLVCVGTGVVDALIYRTGQPSHTLLVHGMALMWTPTMAMIVARLVLREGIADVSFRSGGRAGLKMLGLAFAYPLLVGTLAYGTAWLLRLEPFQVPPRWASRGPVLRLLSSLGLNLTLGTLISAVSAAGEEFGWRGYMLTRLVDAGVRRPALVSGVVWATWHLPLILTGQYAAGRFPLLSVLLFLISTTAGGVFVARLRLESGSVWPAVFFHAAWNAAIQGSFDRFTAGGNSSHAATIWTGESGILVALVSVGVAWWLGQSRQPRLRAPGDVIA